MEKNTQRPEDEQEKMQNASAEEGTTHNQEASHKKGGIHNNALYAAGMGRPATAQVDPHSNSGLAQTGTNTSYEGPLAAGAGGSAGTGYTSGQAGTGAKIATDSDFDQARVTTKNDSAKDADAQADEAEDELNEQR